MRKISQDDRTTRPILWELVVNAALENHVIRHRHAAEAQSRTRGRASQQRVAE